MNDDINDYLPSLLNPRCVKKQNGAGDFSLTQNSVISRTSSLSLRRPKKSLTQPFADLRNKNISPILRRKIQSKDKENFRIPHCFTTESPKHAKPVLPTRIVENIPKNISINFNCSSLSGLDYLDKPKSSSPLSFSEFEPTFNYKHYLANSKQTKALVQLNKPDNSNQLGLSNKDSCNETYNKATALVKQPETISDCNVSLISLSSATELNKSDLSSDGTVVYDVDKDIVNVTLGLSNCNDLNLSTKHSNIKNITVTTRNNEITLECEVIEGSETSSSFDENMNERTIPTPPKKPRVSVNLEIKKKNPSDTDQTENSKVLILNTNAIEKVSHVIVQPPNCKLVKKQTFSTNPSCIKRNSLGSAINNGKCGLIQKRLDLFFPKTSSGVIEVSDAKTVGKESCAVLSNDAKEMSKHFGVADVVKCEGKPSQHTRKDKVPRSARLPKKDNESQRVIKSSNPDVARGKESATSQSPRKATESIQFNLSKTKTNKSVTKSIPHYKLVAGTHFAVDAFSYGDIPNVKNYFLTHFHSDHYTGLKKSFNKLLICSKITADLCISRLGVNPKCIHVINVDDTLRVEGTEVTAVDANHCPGAIMLVFTLPNGKSLLHTGDFRATPIMESYPVFWNKDLHTIYLDTTYCNPRYDFPTQDQSLEMALYILRQKKLDLEKAGKKFSSVLIVCGTYTIGKEKFFLGIARRVGCSVWACPEKDRVLQAVEGRSFSHAPPHSCQLHVVPMRDLTYEKLRSYLDSLQGAFSEVVAFKPSGWENGKNTAVEKDLVTIHGIPYSEHSSFSEMVRFVKFLKPKQVVPTVDISGGVKAVQKYFPCPLVYKEDSSQSRVTDFFSIQQQPQVPAVT